MNATIRLVFDRKHEATKTRPALVQVEIYCQKKRKFFTTGIRLCSNQWKKGTVRNHPQSDVLNRRLKMQVDRLYGLMEKMDKESQPFSMERLEHMMKYERDEESFMEFMHRELLAHPVSSDTKMKYLGVYRALTEFGRIRYFSDVTYANILEFDRFARTRCEKQSAVYNYHKVLKIFVRAAHARQLIKFNPYLMFKLNKGLTARRKYLTREELKLIEDKQIPNESLARVRDVFLFCCYTGLAYADLKKFDFSKAVKVGSMYRIQDVRKKTGTEYNISLIDKAMALLRKYSFSLPVISLQKYNDYLKVLGAYCEVKKGLTSHVARHTFATMMMSCGVRIEVISKMLGHTNIQTTQLYAKVMQSEVDSEFDRINSMV